MYSLDPSERINVRTFFDLGSDEMMTGIDTSCNWIPYRTDDTHIPDNFSDFRPIKKRTDKWVNSSSPKFRPYEIKISENDINLFLDYYSAGSKDCSLYDSRFDPSYYLELFLIMNLKNELDSKTDQSDKNKIEFFGWASENKNCFDLNKISMDIFSYLDNKSYDVWNAKNIDIMDIETVYDHISGINSVFDTLEQLKGHIWSKGRFPYDQSIDDISKSIKRYIKQDIDTVVDEMMMFNILKQGCQNRYAPNILKELIKFSGHVNASSLYQNKTINLIEHFSKMYNDRKMNGTFNIHKEELQEIYNIFGGNRKEELFPSFYKAND